MSDLVDSEEFTVPLYTQREAANLIGVPANTFQHWARGYLYKTLAGEQRTATPIVTTSGLGRGPVVPFVGLGEAYVIAAFRKTGVPMQRIRPAIAWLEQNIGMRAALTSERLKTDGAEVLYDFARSHSADPAAEPIDELVVVRNQQAVFRDVIQQYLQTVTYRDGRLAVIRMPGYTADVVLDPRLNFGQPTLASRGIRVTDIVDRVTAGEPASDVAADFGIDPRDVRALFAA